MLKSALSLILKEQNRVISKNIKGQSMTSPGIDLTFVLKF